MKVVYFQVAHHRKALEKLKDAVIFWKIDVLTTNDTSTNAQYRLDALSLCTGKSLSETLLFSEHGENMLCTKIVSNVRNNFCTQHVLPRFEIGIYIYYACNSKNNLSSYCGLVDAKIRASDKDLPVPM